MLDPVPHHLVWSKAGRDALGGLFQPVLLPDHVHEILLTFAFISGCIFSFAPRLSAVLFHDTIHSSSARTRLNWDIHAVSFVQASLSFLVGVVGHFMIRSERVNFVGRVYG